MPQRLTKTPWSHSLARSTILPPPAPTFQGPSGIDLTHKFSECGTYAVRVTATDKDGLTGPAAVQNIQITAYAIQIDPIDGKRNLVVGSGGHDSEVEIERAERGDG